MFWKQYGWEQLLLVKARPNLIVKRSVDIFLFRTTLKFKLSGPSRPEHDFLTEHNCLNYGKAVTS